MLETDAWQQVELIGEQGIANSHRLVLKAQGFRTTSEAQACGIGLADVLTLALVRHRIGAELWARRGSGMFFGAGLRMLEQESGHRVLNDQVGLMVPDAIALVDGFIETVRKAPLPVSERDSLQGALRWLRRESIRGAGRRIAIDHLGDRTYDGRPAPAFFADCYDLRSELVHGGDIRMARERAAAAAGQLEVFVSDLIFAKFAG